MSDRNPDVFGPKFRSLTDNEVTLNSIRSLCRVALTMNKTVNDDVLKDNPIGFMPPMKRKQIIKILEEIMIKAGGIL